MTGEGEDRRDGRTTEGDGRAEVPMGPGLKRRPTGPLVKRPRPGPRPSPPPTILQIRHPHDGDTIYTTELRVAWQYTWPEAEDPSFTRVLLKNGVELQRIGPINYYPRDLSDSLNLFGRISGTEVPPGP